VSSGTEQKPATAARIYDYHLGGTHNFPADRAAAQAVVGMYPLTPLLVRTNRAFLRRAVRHLAEAGIDQFLDIGSGIPTEGNVHEIAQAVNPKAHVVYVDIDPVAVLEGLDILEGNEFATAIRGDARDAEAVLANPQVRRLIDFDRPAALLLCAVLHFVPDNEVATGAVSTLLEALPSGSYLVISHAAPEQVEENFDVVNDIYRKQTTTPFKLRTRDEVGSFFSGLGMVEPGLVWLPQWRPAAGDPADFIADPPRCVALGGVGRKP
jgi:SAM-dependent methyltransferase